MLNKINNGDGTVNNDSIIRQQVIGNVGQRTTSNPYAKQNDLVDKTDISNEAVSLFQREKDIEKFKNLVMDSLDTENYNADIAELIDKGAYQISEEDLAQSMINNDDLLNMLFG